MTRRVVRPATVDRPGPHPPWPLREVATGRGVLAVRAAPPLRAGAAPALFVHGLGGASTNWTDLMALLRDRLDGEAVDLPGFGYSPPPADGDYTPRGHAAALVALLEARGRGPVHLFGNSLGGAVAVRLAATRPDLVTTLTLVSPALPDLRPRRGSLGLPLLAAPLLGERLAAALARQDPYRRAASVVRLCFGDPSAVPPERLAEAAAEVARRAELPHSQDAMLASLRGLLLDYVRGPAGRAVWRLAASVAAPTLLVYGGKDRLVDARMGPRAQRTFPDARLLVLPDSGHVAQIEHAPEVAAAVRDLLDATAARGRRAADGAPAGPE